MQYGHGDFLHLLKNTNFENPKENVSVGLNNTMKNFIIVLFIFFLLLLPTVIFANPYEWPILRVIDGDTVVFKADFLPLDFKQELSLRIWGIDTPEKGFRAQCDQESAMSDAATQFTIDSINSAKKREIYIKEWDKYGGRVLGDLILDGKNLRLMLLENGYAREYYGDKKLSWCINPQIQPLEQ